MFSQRFRPFEVSHGYFKVKKKLRGFDAWYAERQISMRTDPILKWLVGARNKIEKQGDLNTRSTLRKITYWGWLDKKVQDIELPVGLTTPEIARKTPKLPKKDIPD